MDGDDTTPAKRDGPYTVGDALDDYFTDHGVAMKSKRETERRAAAFIRPALGGIAVIKLTPQRIKKWHVELSEQGKRVRTKIGAAPKVLAADLNDPDAQRARRDSANRVLTILKAALNHAWREGKVIDDGPWRKVRPFPATTKARVRFLVPAEQQRLLNACHDPDLRDLAAAGLLTGCRFGELARLHAEDWHRNRDTVFVAQSKSGRARHVPVGNSGKALFDRLSAGKTTGARLLIRANGDAWGKSVYTREFRAAAARAKVTPLTFHELRHSFASTLLAGATPLMMVAEALGHADSRMCEKHYGHLAKEHVFERLRAAAPMLDVGRTAVARID
ncbi:tyrosine-type recombinase/integrase [Inquilinus sp. YAF38]|uniref:tyrosine-type recombinase/integrase n=1 Tax=Inquilinus sp. YAF38 TaxID=3233084 RepID=UPI003F8E2DF9